MNNDRTEEITMTILSNENIDFDVVGGSGTSNYERLSNKPHINDVELIGNKTSADLGLQPAGEYLTEETDPIFTASASANITSEDITNWNNKSDFSGNYNDLSNKPTIPSNTSDLINNSGFIDKNVNNLTYYTLKTSTGSLIDLEVNSSTYVVTLYLKDIDGNVISTDSIDLPLESVVVSGSFDSVNKKIVLTLQNGNTVDIPVGDLVAGLQTEITTNNKLASDLIDDSNSGNKFATTSEKTTWNDKYDKPIAGIPSTDMTSAVQTSLGKADSAIQSSDLTDYVKNTDYATNSTGGVIKVGSNGFFLNANNYPEAQNRNYENYQGAGNNIFISKGTLENVITGKDLTTKSYVDGLVGDIDTALDSINGESI